MDAAKRDRSLIRRSERHRCEAELWAAVYRLLWPLEALASQRGVSSVSPLPDEPLTIRSEVSQGRKFPRKSRITAGGERSVTS